MSVINERRSILGIAFAKPFRVTGQINEYYSEPHTQMSDISQKLDKRYEEVMQNHPYGIALYRPLRTSLFKPGAFGYFDEIGEWNLIGNLEDAELLARKGFSPVEVELEKAPIENGIKWGPMASLNLKGTKIQMAAGM